jgi:hypothetical protein
VYTFRAFQGLQEGEEEKEESSGKAFKVDDAIHFCWLRFSIVLSPCLESISSFRRPIFHSSFTGTGAYFTFVMCFGQTSMYQGIVDYKQLAKFS